MFQRLPKQITKEFYVHAAYAVMMAYDRKPPGGV